MNRKMPPVSLEMRSRGIFCSCAGTAPRPKEGFKRVWRPSEFDCMAFVAGYWELIKMPKETGPHVAWNSDIEEWKDELEKVYYLPNANIRKQYAAKQRDYDAIRRYLDHYKADYEASGMKSILKPGGK